MKFNECYFRAYRTFCDCADRIFTLVALVLFTGGLATFFAAQGWPRLAAALLVASQICSLGGHLLPFTRQVQGLNGAIAFMPELLTEMEYEWAKIEADVYTDEEIMQLTFERKRAYDAMERVAFNGMKFIRWGFVAEKAEGKTVAFFRQRFGVSAQEV
jgi:hypothetical protein